MQPSEKKRSKIEVQLEFKFEAALKSNFEVIESEIEVTLKYKIEVKLKYIRNRSKNEIQIRSHRSQM